MARCLRLALLLMFAVFAWMSVAFASAVNIHTIVIDVPAEDGFCTTPVPCSLDIGDGFGSPATGSADFTSVGLPWTFDFETGRASTFCGGFSGPPCPSGDSYDASFDSGSFTMTGPARTFTGVVKSGNVAAAGLGFIAGSVSYFGQWSDGLHGFGTASFTLDEPDNLGSVHLDSNLTGGVVPEPSTLLLFGSGLLLLGIIVYRKQLHVRDGLIDGCPAR